MIKYTNAEVVFQEIPDEITLAINLSNCPIHCPDCHSKELWKDIGTDLTFSELSKLIDNNPGISCVCFMGGDAEPDTIVVLAELIKAKYPNLKVGWYSGQSVFPHYDLESFDYIKIGPFIKEKGGLNNPNTNQKLYAKDLFIEETSHKLVGGWIDITHKFWKNEQ